MSVQFDLDSVISATPQTDKLALLWISMSEAVRSLHWEGVIRQEAACKCNSNDIRFNAYHSG